MAIVHNPFDDPKLAQVRAEQEDPIVQYYIVRKDVPMSVGKVCAQIAHGAQMFLSEYYNLKRNMNKPFGGRPLLLTQITEKWMAGSFRKVVLGAKKKDWEKIKKELEVFVVRDAGLTEVESGTETVMVTWPMKKSNQPKVLANLQVLKSALSPEDQTCQTQQTQFSPASSRALRLKGNLKKLCVFRRLFSSTSLMKRPRSSSMRT